MKKPTTKSLNYFWTSLGVHLFILLLIMLHLKNVKGFNTPEALYIPAYTYHEFVQPQKINIEKKNFKSLPMEKSTISVARQNKQEESLQKSFTRQIMNSKQQIQNIKNNAVTHRELLKILHDAIAAKQIYPENALALNQSGKVTVQFDLYPMGEIKNISIATSSGIKSLDEAALNAVKAVSYTHFNYLNTKEIFSIDVEFR